MPESSQAEEVIQQVLEQHAYLFGDPVPASQLPATLEDLIEVVVAFHGAFTGRMVLSCTRELSHELAANVLGMMEPDEIEDEDAEDALKELMNVLAGRLLAQLEAEPGLVQIGPPMLGSDADGSHWKDLLGSTGTCSFLVEDHPAMFRLELENA